MTAAPRATADRSSSGAAAVKYIKGVTKMEISTLRRALLVLCALSVVIVAVPASASAAPEYPAKCEVSGTLGPVAGLFNMGMKCASRPIGTVACRGNVDQGNRVMYGRCASSDTIIVRPVTCDFKGGFIIGFNPELWIGDQVSVICRRLSSTTTVPIVCLLNGGGPINKDQTFTGTLTGGCQYGYGK